MRLSTTFPPLLYPPSRCLQGAASQWAPLLRTLPAQTLSPLLWSDAELAELLGGSPVLAEARARQAALRQEWAEIQTVMEADEGAYPAGGAKGLGLGGVGILSGI